MRKSRPGAPPLPNDWVDLLNRFAASLAAEDLAPATVRGYLRDLRAFLHWLEHTGEAKSPTPAAISRTDLTTYRHYLVAEKRHKPATVNRSIDSLRRFFAWADNLRLVEHSPADGLRRLRDGSRYRPKALAEPEIYRLLQAAGSRPRRLGERNYALVQLFLQTGLRLSDVAGLQGADLILRDRSGSVRVCQGKGRKEREIPLNATARRALRDYFAARGEPHGDMPVFRVASGRGMSARSLEHTIAELARRARISRIHVTPHALRHTFAISFLRQHPGKLVELARLLGHDSLDTTAIYVQPSEEEMAEHLEQGARRLHPGTPQTARDRPPARAKRGRAHARLDSLQAGSSRGGPLPGR
ncbi:MAG: tyrosine-type recombinase/integrase [Candidatus Schekmanbacteria bacterium]|nr:tyrosine-type recombinase/integrase [Candidatus Schekmanbacteria bacterium]